MTVDLCHVLGCDKPAAAMEWCPGLGVCIQVCTEHGFATLSPDAVIDLERATVDHEQNISIYHKTTHQ